jgi:hypothetical protein
VGFTDSDVNPSSPFVVWRPALGRSRTRSAKTTAITKHSELTDVLIRLMLSVNDIALASDANDEWASETAQRRVYRKAAARMYFIRVLMGHVYEGLIIIEHISRVPDLRAAVDGARAVADVVGPDDLTHPLLVFVAALDRLADLERWSASACAPITQSGHGEKMVRAAWVAKKNSRSARMPEG